jgi:hypothetical protein
LSLWRGFIPSKYKTGAYYFDWQITKPSVSGMQNSCNMCTHASYFLFSFF